MVSKSISHRLIEGLYCEALVLSDEVRAHFNLTNRASASGPSENEAQVALSCESLRTTTRMMHATAWLLNHRAFLIGEMSEFRLRMHGKLPEDFPADPHRLALLPEAIVELINATQGFYARLCRIDQRMRGLVNEQPPGIDIIRQRMGLPVAA